MIVTHTKEQGQGTISIRATASIFTSTEVNKHKWKQGRM